MDEIEKYLIQLTDEQKKNRLKSETNPYYIKILVMNLEKDEDKIAMTDKLADRDKIDVWCNLKSDDLKLEILDTMEKEHHFIRLAQMLQSDDNKIQVLDYFEGDDLGTQHSKSKIISTIKDDDKKIATMEKHIENSTFRLEIIKTLQSNQKKIDNLGLITDDYDKKNLLEDIEITNDEQRLTIVKAFTKDYNKLPYIREMNEDNREKSLQLVSDSGVKKDVILTLSPERRLEHLEDIKPGLFQYKEEIIDSIEDDEIKKKYLGKEKNQEVITKILMSIKDDTYKLEKIEELVKEESNRALVIASLKDDEIKSEKIQELLDKDNQLLVKISFQDSKRLKENFLKSKRTYKQIGVDKEISIGIEIESEGERAELLRKLKNFLKGKDEKENRKWETKGDLSLSDQDGLEVVSPILIDSKKDVEEIYMTCEMLKQAGQEANEKCGAHVHIGAEYLKSKEAYANLLEIWGNTERIMYIITNEPGSIPRGGTSQHAEPISYKIAQAIEEGSIELNDEQDLQTFISSLQKMQNNKERSLNLLNINNQKNTIEFRVANGTINPDVWIENIKLFGRLVQRAEELAEIEQKSNINEEERQQLELKERLKEDIPEKEKLEIVLDILFEEEEKEVYRERYKENSNILKRYRI